MPSDELNPLVYKLLNRTLAFHMNDQAVDCERHREEQGQRIKNLKDTLIQKGVVDPQWSKLYIDDCVLEAEWSGVLDFRDTFTDPRKTMTKPSLAWTCQPLECHIEGDLPVPLEKEHEAVKEINQVEHCCVDIVHHHEDPIEPEAHIHVVCKGVHPSDLGVQVNSLVKKVLKFRGHEIE